ncbi:MAG: helix-turn-helix domain-containing protein [Lachnospiraceae bacterium]|nr:helix-turn-helix domain-containing protein [Lachnospiraceae bacterium]
MNHKEQYFSQIRERYPAYVTQAEFAKIAGICKKTAYKLNRTGKVPYREVRIGFRHHYEIRTEDVISYLASHMPEVDCKVTDIWRQALHDYLAPEADVLKLKDVVRISGIGKNNVDRWVKSGRLKAFKCRNVYQVTKEDLIDYLASPYYRFAHRKSTEWYRIERHVLAYEAKELKTKTQM